MDGVLPVTAALRYRVKCQMAHNGIQGEHVTPSFDTDIEALAARDTLADLAKNIFGNHPGDSRAPFRVWDLVIEGEYPAPGTAWRKVFE